MAGKDIRNFYKITAKIMKSLRFFIIVFGLIIPSALFAQTDIVTKQDASTSSRLTEVATDNFRQIVESILKQYKVKVKERKIDEYMSGQFKKDFAESYNELAMRYLTEDDIKYLKERKNDASYVLANEHQRQLNKMVVDSAIVFMKLAKEIGSDGQSAMIDYDAPERYVEKWQYLSKDDNAILEGLRRMVQSAMDTDEFETIFVPSVKAKICNWSFKYLTEQDLDVLIKEKDSPANQHSKEYQRDMVNGKLNIAEPLAKRVMAYFGIEN